MQHNNPWKKRVNKAKAMLAYMAAHRRESQDIKPPILKNPRKLIVKASNLPCKPAKPEHSMTKELLVFTDRFSASAFWKFIRGKWSCVWADPKISWMLGCHPDSVKCALNRMDAKFKWVAPQSDKGTGASRQYPDSATQIIGGTNPSQGMTNPTGLPLAGNDTVPSVAPPSLQTGA